MERSHGGLVIIGGSGAGISAALRARKVVTVRAVRISCSLPGATTNRSRSPAFSLNYSRVLKPTYFWLMQLFGE